MARLCGWSGQFSSAGEDEGSLPHGSSSCRDVALALVSPVPCPSPVSPPVLRRRRAAAVRPWMPSSGWHTCMRPGRGSLVEVRSCTRRGSVLARHGFPWPWSPRRRPAASPSAPLASGALRVGPRTPLQSWCPGPAPQPATLRGRPESRLLEDASHAVACYDGDTPALEREDARDATRESSTREASKGDVLDLVAYNNNKFISRRWLEGGAPPRRR